jgi:hypothetical protein
LANNTTDGSYNSAFGYSSLYTNKTGTRNTASGYKALYSNYSGSYNTAVGTFSLYHTTTSNYNTAIGYAVLIENITGDANTAAGYNSLASNTTGSYNTASGYYSLSSNTLGNSNTATGSYALYLSTVGYHNTANGYGSLYHNTSGSYNTAIGSSALFCNTTGSYNTAIGFTVLSLNTTGRYNTAVGYYSLELNDSGYGNTASGYYAMLYNKTGFYNTATGFKALFANSTGKYNSAFGDSSLITNNTGSYNTALGTYADVSKDSLTNATAIGYKAKVNGSNKVRVGNNAVTSIGGQVSWTTFSDGRYKKNIKENVLGLAFINSLRPVTYTVNVQGLNNYFDKKNNHEVNENTSGNDLNEADNTAAKIVYNGFLAQEVEAAAKKLNYQFSGVDVPKNNNDLYGLRYAEFVVPLVKAVQELSTENDNLKKQAAQNEKYIADIEKRLAKMETLMPCQQSFGSNKQGIHISGSLLEQNFPNPFSTSATINYTLPQPHASAVIIIRNEAGKTIKEINVSGKSKGSLTVNASVFNSGAYTYCLYVDGKAVATKQMVIAK